MVFDRLSALYVALVAPLILLNVVLLAEDCHCKVPTVPPTLKVVALVPAQTDAAPVILPALGAGLMST